MHPSTRPDHRKHAKHDLFVQTHESIATSTRHIHSVTPIRLTQNSQAYEPKAHPLQLSTTSNHLQETTTTHIHKHLRAIYPALPAQPGQDQATHISATYLIQHQDHTFCSAQESKCRNQLDQISSIRTQSCRPGRDKHFTFHFLYALGSSDLIDVRFAV